ncbi:Uncharacterised protein [Vibrio cholerae]|nr:Uncharacterised protein [Vibrio cholerae]
MRLAWRPLTCECRCRSLGAIFPVVARQTSDRFQAAPPPMRRNHVTPAKTFRDDGPRATYATLATHARRLSAATRPIAQSSPLTASSLRQR